MIAIVNVDKSDTASGPHKYEIRINKRVVTTFTHNREDSLQECLLKAAIAVESKVIPGQHGRRAQLLESQCYKLFTEEKRWLAWGVVCKNKPLCVHFKNIDRGVECTANNCPCDLYETETYGQLCFEG